MKPSRFHHLLQAFGAELRRWPADERAAAQRLMQVDPTCRAACTEAARLDALLAEDAASPLPSGEEEAIAARLQREVMAAIPGRPRRSSAWTITVSAAHVLTWSRLAGVSAGVAALLLGAWVGWTQVGDLVHSASGLLSSLQLSPVLSWVL
jgi:anti-sigma factor RsiW